METLNKLLEGKSPNEALGIIAETVKKLFRHVGDEERLDFVKRLMDDSGTESIASMVNL